MTQANATLIESILAEAIEIGSPLDRARFIQQSCNDNQAVKAEVERLLENHFRAGKFLELATPCYVAEMPLTMPRDESGERIGPYKLLEKIGEGGMGLVYMAEQVKPVRRRVALKLIKPGMDTKQFLARFEAERQALAIMEHPNIARVLDAGATDQGRPYFVMELVRGIPITEFCDQAQLSTRERLVLFKDLCMAVQHAHMRGIIHRDLKPTNVLVTMNDDKPLVKIIDFGIAKATNQQLTDRTLFTSFQQMVGTPMYMSPEQAQMNNIDVDTRSDIYSLGVMLYEILTGETPFDRERLRRSGFEGYRKLLLEVDPPRPSQRISTLRLDQLSTASKQRKVDMRKFSQSLQGELDWIVMKSIEKDRRRRYNSASELSDDIDRYLKDQAVQACPPAIGYRLSKFVRRYRAPLSTAALFCLVLIGSTAFSIRFALQANNAKAESDRKQLELITEKSESDRQRALAQDLESEARKEKYEAKRNLYKAGMRLASIDLKSLNIARLHQILNSHIPASKEPDFRGWEWYYLLGASHQESLTFVGDKYNDVAWSPDGSKVASVGRTKTLRIWDAQNGTEVATVDTGSGFNATCAWSNDSQRIAWGTMDNTFTAGFRIYDVPSGELQEKVWDTSPGRRVFAVAWSPDGRRLATGSRPNSFRIWDIESKTVVREFEGSGGQLWSLCWNPDGSKLVTASIGSESGLRIWNTVTGKLERDLGLGRGYKAAVYSMNGEFVVAGDQIGNCAIFNVIDGSLVHQFPAHRGEIKDAAMDPTGTHVCTVGDDGIVRVWSLATGNLETTLTGHEGIVNSIAWNPSGTQIVTGSEDGTVRIWSIDDGDKVMIPIATDEKVVAPVEFSGDIYSKSNVDPQTAITNSNRSDFAYDSLRKQLIPSDEVPDDTVIRDYIAKANTDSLPWPTSLCRLNVPGTDTLRVAIVGSKDKSKLVVVRPIKDGYRFELWQSNQFSPTQLTVSADYFFSVSWSWDDNRVSIASISNWEIGRFEVFDVRTCDLKMRRLTGEIALSFICWSHTGSMIATGDRAGEICIWNAGTGEKLCSSRVHRQGVMSLAFSPDDKRIASSCWGYGQVSIIDVQTGEAIMNIYDDANRPQIRSLEWSKNGNKLTGITRNGLEMTWDASRGYHLETSSQLRNSRAVADSLDQAKGDFDTLTYMDRLSANQQYGDLINLADQHRDTKDWRIWNNRGGAELSLGMIEDSIYSYRKAISLNPRANRSMARKNLARALFRANRDEEAVQELQIAFEQYNSMEAATRILGFYKKKGDKEREVELRRHMLHRAEKITDLFEKRFVLWYYHAAGLPRDEMERAMTLAREVDQQHSKFPESKRWIGYLYYQMGDYQKALECIASSAQPIKNAPSVYCWYFLTMTHAKLKHLDEANYWLDKANQEATIHIAREPDSREVLIAMRAEATQLINEAVDANKNN